MIFVRVIAFFSSVLALVVSAKVASVAVETADKVKDLEDALENALRAAKSPVAKTPIPIEPVTTPVSRNQHAPDINVASLGPKFEGNFSSNIEKE